MIGVTFSRFANRALLTTLIVLAATFPAFVAQSADLAVSQSQGYVILDQIRCLVVDPTRAMRKQKPIEPDLVAEILKASFPAKQITISATPAACRSVFFITIAGGGTPGIALDGRRPSYLVSIGVCDWPNLSERSASTCLSKNVDVFERNVSTAGLLREGLRGLVHRQSDGTTDILRNPSKRI